MHARGLPPCKLMKPFVDVIATEHDAAVGLGLGEPEAALTGIADATYEDKIIKYNI